VNVKPALSALALAALFVSADACDSCKKGYVFGRPVPVGNGMAYSWAKLDEKTKKPVSIGVTLTETALEGLPPVESMDPKMPVMEMVLEVPQEIKGLPYDHITLDWNPVGHPPMKIYDKPHFDLHFYTINQKDRSKITMKGDGVKTSRMTPAKGVMAAGYILPPDVEIPTMGSHWIDPTSPELRGQPFESTYIYGTYGGKLTFLEPMVALSFLQTKPTFEKKVAIPSVVGRTGYYPAKYKVAYNEKRKEYNISLEDLAYLKAAK
jgi:hypothetical protein